MTTTPAPTRGPDLGTAVTAAALAATAGGVLVVALLVVGGGSAPSTFADPGPATTTGLPLVRYAQQLLAVLTVGAALVAVLVGPGQGGPGGEAHDDAAVSAVVRRSYRLLTATATAWAALTVVLYVLTASDLSGRPPAQVLTEQVQVAFLGLPQARALLLVLLVSVVLAVAARLLRPGPAVPVPGAAPRAALLLLATAGLVPPAFVGHSANADAHELAVGSLSVHVVAASLWVGGLAVLAVVVLADRRTGLRTALRTTRSFSALALVAVLAVAASGTLNAALRLAVPGQLVSTAYGLLLVAKVAGLAVLVGFGWWHRTRSLAAAARDDGDGDGDGDGDDGAGAGTGRAALTRLVAVELVVMVLVVAVAVALARTPPPV